MRTRFEVELPVGDPAEMVRASIEFERGPGEVAPHVSDLVSATIDAAINLSAAHQAGRERQARERGRA